MASASGMSLWYWDCLLTEPAPSDPSTFSNSTYSKYILSSPSEAQLDRVILQQWSKQRAEQRLWWSLAKQLILILHSQRYCPFGHGWGSFRTTVFFIHFYLFFHKPETCGRVKEGGGTQMCRYMVVWTHANTFTKVAEPSKATPSQCHSNWVTGHPGKSGQPPVSRAQQWTQKELIHPPSNI